MGIRAFLGRRLARYLSKPLRGGAQVATSRWELLADTLRRGDVLLVEGNTRFSVPIKYLTQSSWSHAALCIGDALGPTEDGGEPRVLLDVDVVEGVRAIPLSRFARMHTRICRPVGLDEAQIDRVVEHAVARLGQHYDLKNVFDLLRYLIPLPVPSRWRRRMIALGSGDPTKAICSTLIAQAFQSVRYPILPEVVFEESADPDTRRARDELLRVRHHSLYAPRDFDVSPYFRIVKPTLEHGFDPAAIRWADAA